MARVGPWLRGLWARAPRRLRVTRPGQVLIALALAAGFAALNTGNNLLFLAWGMVLGAMVVSGLLSEAALRPLSVRVIGAEELRAQVPGHVRLEVRNTSRLLPALAIETAATWTDRMGFTQETFAPYQLRIDAGAVCTLFMPMTPARRGPYTLTALAVQTAYPFGLFIKKRPLPPPPLVLWAQPAPGPAQPQAQALAANVGQRPAGRAGAGEDYFATRAYRPGDALKQVLWRRVARTGRWLVVEREMHRARELTLYVYPNVHADGAAQETALSAVGALIEGLLLAGLDVALVAPTLAVAPGHDRAGTGRQRRALLQALARLDVRPGNGPSPPGPGPHAGGGRAQVALLAPGLQAPPWRMATLPLTIAEAP